MERRVKIFILLIAFLLDMWIWDSGVETVADKILFIFIFLAAPLFWGLVMDVRDGAIESPSEKDRFSYSLRRKAPFIAGVLTTIFILLLEVPQLFGVHIVWIQSIELIFVIGIFGFLWALAIRDLEIGER
jgi:hypothetical protein